MTEPTYDVVIQLTCLGIMVLCVPVIALNLAVTSWMHRAAREDPFRRWPLWLRIWGKVLRIKETQR